jgi:photosystem I subunit VI
LLPKRRCRPRAAVVAKYGDKSIYFDLEDIGNTTGQWDLYGSDAPSPYNPLQVRKYSNLFHHLMINYELSRHSICYTALIIKRWSGGFAQSKFFEKFAGPFTKRGLLLKFLLLGGGSLLAYVSSSTSPDLLPIKKGPQQPPQMGPRGKI